jgi:hypothetical protein
MGQRKKAILFSDPVVVAGVILMMVSVDNGIGMKCVQEFQKSISTKGEACIDQQPINKKSVNFVNGKTQKSTGHSNRLHGTIWFHG